MHIIRCAHLCYNGKMTEMFQSTRIRMDSLRHLVSRYAILVGTLLCFGYVFLHVHWNGAARVDKMELSGEPGEQADYKKIYTYHSFPRWGKNFFSGCPINKCRLMAQNEDPSHADLVVFRRSGITKLFKRPMSQIWLIYSYEAPTHTQAINDSVYKFNWTASYRMDSTIPIPYGKYVEVMKKNKKIPNATNYAQGKTKMAAWFVSNCNDFNNRYGYAQALGNHIDVDIYGACGKLKCKKRNTTCDAMLKNDYKFYLAFENSNCMEYITEKLYKTAYTNNVIPIVMGARLGEYRRLAPPHSFIHVDQYDSIGELASYLELLNLNDDLYNEYFRWKPHWKLVDQKFACRLCRKLHTQTNVTWYENNDKWWRGAGVCMEVTSENPYASWKVHKKK